MTDMNGEIIPLWQPPGFSTHLIARRISESLGVKTSHTGTLDPMAEGVIIILTDELRNKKYDYASWLKTYEFDLVLGIATDTFGFLGKLTKETIPTEISHGNITKVIKEFAGEYEQEVPPYSAIKIKGKPLHWYARNNRLNEVEIPTRTGKIKQIEVVDIGSKCLDQLIPEQIARIKSIEGDLRQEEIIQQWDQIGENPELQIVKTRVTTTKGLYVRRLATDIAEKLDTTGIAVNIVRIQNGDYTKENSKKVQVYGM
jgi:tRNA pseudouridine(55) synthase